MRVIVTRPEIGGRRTADRLAAMGHDAVLLPLTEPEHRPQAAAEALHLPHAVIAITSAEAVRTLSAVEQADLQPAFDTPVHAVGTASATAARNLGFRQVTAGPGTGAGLAQKLACDGVQDVLYLAGRPRSALFEAGLAAAGIRFRTVEVYSMRPAALKAEQLTALSPHPDAVLFYSSEAARIFMNHPALRHALPDLARMTAFCLSRTIADALPADSFGTIRVAPEPSEEQLLLLL
ncbi:uroporphyrinogen-III synthase [Rhizobium sp. 0TCS1.26]|uniref:uroporphyrinogen-III synthase n=1 Tax=Rhizobium sp. 0TCS1.26 TaxID=3142623 RepID=UPI003D2671CC